MPLAPPSLTSPVSAASAVYAQVFLDLFGMVLRKEFKGKKGISMNVEMMAQPQPKKLVSAE